MIDLFYFFSLLLGQFKKIFLLEKYQAENNFKLYATGGIIGTKKKIIIGKNVVLHGWLISDGGTIVIGDNTIIHRGTIIRSMSKIQIGNYCDIGSDCYIQDHNSMSLNYLERRNHNGKIITLPISIGDDVWIGRRATLLKGVNIGDKAIIGTCAVVVKNVPSGATAVGNPARLVNKSI